MNARDWFDHDVAQSTHFDRINVRPDTSLERRYERGWVIFCALVCSLAFLFAQVTP